MDPRRHAHVHAIVVLFALVPRLASAAPATSAATPPPTVARCLDASEEGQRSRDEGKLSAARALFETCAATTCPSVVRTNCTAWLEGVQRAMPTIVPTVRDDLGNDLIDATLRIDGGPEEKITGRAIELDLGAHVLEVAAPGHVAHEERLLAVSGEKSRIVRFELKRVATDASERKPTPREAPPKTAPPIPPAPERRSIPPFAVALAGAGIVAGGFSLAIGLTTRSDISQLGSSPCAATKTCADSDVEGLRTRLVVADMLLGVAVAALVGASIVWAFSGRHAR